MLLGKAVISKNRTTVFRGVNIAINEDKMKDKDTCF